jgi:hypothetical protein
MSNVAPVKTPRCTELRTCIPMDEYVKYEARCKKPAVPGKPFAYDSSSMDSLLAKLARTEHAPLSRPFLFKNFWDSKQRSLKNFEGISMG